MRLRSILIILMAGVLLSLVTGCFRQASEPFESADEPLPPGESIPANDEDDEDASTGTDDESVSGTPTFGIPVITSTPITFAEEPTATDIPATATTDTGGVDSTETPVPTPIIPGLPSGPVETNTPGPTNTPDAAIPTLEPLETPVDPFAEANTDCIHIVARGDTVFRIAQNNGTTVAAIQEANPGLNPELIQPGDEIILPNCEPSTSADVPQPAPTMIPGTDPQPVQPPGSAPLPTVEPLVHIVSAGETLGRIADQYDVTVLQIVQANNLANPNQLSVGQELIIPPPEGG